MKSYIEDPGDCYTTTAKAKRPKPVRCSAWLERGLLWLAKRDMRKAQERMELAAEILRITGRPSAAEEARESVTHIKEALDWVRPRSNHIL